MIELTAPVSSSAAQRWIYRHQPLFQCRKIHYHDIPYLFEVYTHITVNQ